MTGQRLPDESDWSRTAAGGIGGVMLSNFQWYRRWRGGRWARVTGLIWGYRWVYLSVRSVDRADEAYPYKEQDGLEDIGSDCTRTREHDLQVIEDANRLRWITTDHASYAARRRCREILARMSGMSYSATCQDIDTLRRAFPLPELSADLVAVDAFYALRKQLAALTDGPGGDTRQDVSVVDPSPREKKEGAS